MVPVMKYKRQIKHGVRKITVDTDSRLASTAAIRQYMHENPDQFDPRKYLSKTIEAMMSVCIARYESFCSAGQADKIKPISMETNVAVVCKWSF